MESTVADPLVGRLLDGRYRLDATLARGGMATVYTATDTRLDRVVAVKVMRTILTDDPEFVARFAEEARAAARLSHAHVVAVHDQGTDTSMVDVDGGTGTAYLVMERVDGHTLRDVLLSEGALAPSRALAFMEPVLRALAAAHAAGIVHRDVKPENVLVGHDGTVKVADFGLARAIQSSQNTATTGMLLGTVAYLAPEQVEHGSSDTRTDVYAAGVLLFELLTGAPPYRSGTPLAIAFRHVHEDVPPPSTRVRGIPTGLDELVVSATRRDAAARPVDAGAFLAELQAVRGELAEGSRPGAAPAPRHPTIALSRPTSTAAAEPAGPSRLRRAGRWRPRRPRLVWLVVLALLLTALVGGGGYVALTTPAPDLVGLTKVQAQQALTDAGFRVEFLPSQFSVDQQAQHIISQEPGAGSRMRRGGTVTLLNSLGPPVRTVPTLVGLSQDQAAAQLVKAGLRLGKVTNAFSDRPEGEVLSADPDAGAQLTPGTSVALVVSKGVELLPVPDVVGQARQNAEKALGNAGFEADVTLAFSDEVDEGDVIAQEPSGGDAARGSAVGLTVSKGPDTVEVPGVGGAASDDAVRRLSGAGLNPKVQKLLSGGPGRVLRTEPSEGKIVKRGSTVTVYVF